MDLVLPADRLDPPPLTHEGLVHRRKAATAALGSQPLWDGYARFGRRMQRTSNEVSTEGRMGRVFAQLVRWRRPEIVVEFGTAFGASGMYWLSGIEDVGSGELLTFEPNTLWAEIARENLQAVSDRFVLTNGTFEDNASAVLDGRLIDLAFIDAIHTPEFVAPQLEIVIAHARPGALLVLDDIHFSPEMRRYWETLARDDARFVASAALGRRVGLLELPGGWHC